MPWQSAQAVKLVVSSMSARIGPCRTVHIHAESAISSVWKPKGTKCPVQFVRVKSVNRLQGEWVLSETAIAIFARPDIRRKAPSAMSEWRLKPHRQCVQTRILRVRNRRRSKMPSDPKARLVSIFSTMPDRDVRAEGRTVEMSMVAMILRPPLSSGQ